MTYEELVKEVDGANESCGRHGLIVLETGEDGCWMVGHPVECATRTVEAGENYEAYYCAFQFELDNCGSDAFDVDPTTLPEGEYPLVWWHRTYYHWQHGPEHDSGIAVAV